MSHSTIACSWGTPNYRATITGLQSHFEADGSNLDPAKSQIIKICRRNTEKVFAQLSSSLSKGSIVEIDPALTEPFRVTLKLRKDKHPPIDEQTE